MPNTSGWQDRHDAALNSPRSAFEKALTQMLNGWEAYADAQKARYDSLIGDDGVLGPNWEAIGDALRGLLNGESGRLDCGTVDAFLLDTMSENGVDTSQK